MLPTFADLGVPTDLVSALSRGSITEPFPIQAMTLPDALAGRDLCGRAPTGSGKTLAFGIATVTRLQRRAQPRRPLALVLTPTRELCAQVAAELAPLAAARGRRVASFYGGVGYGAQLKALAKGVDIAVACPGRLADLISGGRLGLGDVEVVVIDEADRMADMGFLPEVRRLLDQTPAERQTMLFSATLDGDVDVLVRKYQRSPARHEIAVDVDDASRAEHRFWKVSTTGRVDLAASVTAACGSTIVFCRTKHGADRVARQLEARGIRSAAIHGDRSQVQRERALAAFAGGRVAALVATDVAARGIHVDDVAVVIHFDPPADAKDYTHRSGRTARAGACGLVVCFVTPELTVAVKRLQRDLGVPQRAEDADPGSLGLGRARAKKVAAPVAAPALARLDVGRPPRQKASFAGQRHRPGPSRQRRPQGAAARSAARSRRTG